MNRALVIFHDAKHPFLRWILKPGFQHCFVCIEDNGLWLAIDHVGPRSAPQIRYMTTSDFDLGGMWRDRGMTVVETQRRAIPSAWPVAPVNCVSMVKRILCLRTWAQTPHELYLYLMFESKENKS